MYTVINWLLFVSIFLVSLISSKIIHNVDEYLYETPIIDLTKNGAETILYVRLCESSTMDGTKTILNMTRYCYCQESFFKDPNNDSCTLPGPTLKMHDNTVINVTIVNELIGEPAENVPHYPLNDEYKDMDVTNVHVHGLHVPPHIDDILVRINPNSKAHSYPYNISYHYPGTFWYHAHHHVKYLYLCSIQ